MARHACHSCDVLKEIYWLKASRFVMAARAPSVGQQQELSEREVQALNDEAMVALRNLLRHINSCYGFTLKRVA